MGGLCTLLTFFILISYSTLKVIILFRHTKDEHQSFRINDGFDPYADYTGDELGTNAAFVVHAQDAKTIDDILNVLEMRGEHQTLDVDKQTTETKIVPMEVCNERHANYSEIKKFKVKKEPIYGLAVAYCFNKEAFDSLHF